MSSAHLSQAATSALRNLSVLIVEDEFDIAQDLTTLLEQRGARVLGPAPDLTAARAVIARENPSCVLLDLNLQGHTSFDFADELIAREIPVVFTTAYDNHVLPFPLRSEPFLQKPVEDRDLFEAILAAAASHTLKKFT